MDSRAIPYNRLLNFRYRMKRRGDFLEGIVLCNNASIIKEEQTGDPTETALLVVGEKFGLYKEPLEKTYKRINEIPFDSNRKMMTTIHQHNDECVIFVKGALERLLPNVTKIEINGTAQRFTEK